MSGPCDGLRPEITRYPSPWPGVPAFMGSEKVSAWRAPSAFEFVCPNIDGGGEGGNVRGPKGFWIVRRKAGSHLVVGPDGCTPIASLRQVLSDVVESAANDEDRKKAKADLDAFDAKVR